MDERRCLLCADGRNGVCHRCKVGVESDEVSKRMGMCFGDVLQYSGYWVHDGDRNLLQKLERWWWSCGQESTTERRAEDNVALCFVELSFLVGYQCVLGASRTDSESP
jgi:hypothetical protein